MNNEIEPHAIPIQREPILYARVGILTLSFFKDKDLDDLYIQLVESLKNDPRVKDIKAYDSAKENVYTITLASGNPGKLAPHYSSGLPVNPNRHIHVAYFKFPIFLNVQVPERVQTKELGDTDVPSDEYWVAWDGVALVIGWQRKGSRQPFSTAAGQIVLSILHDAAHAAEMSVNSQPCGPNCSFPFAHSRITAYEGDHGGDDVILSGTGLNVNARLPAGTNQPTECIGRLYTAFRFSVHYFAAMRAEEATMSEASNYARTQLADLLGLSYKSVAIKRKFSARYLAERWKVIGWRSEARRIVAVLWLALATVEAKKQEWANIKFVYDNCSREGDVYKIFSSEYAESVNVIEQIDVSNLKSAIEHASSRLDTNSIVWSTALAAVIGAVVGAVVTVLASGIMS